LEKKKSQISIEELTSGLPGKFKTYLYYVRSLKFEEHPNYDFLRLLFYECIEENSFELDNVFDWTYENREESISTQSTTTTTNTENNNNSDLELEKKRKKNESVSIEGNKREKKRRKLN